MLIAILAGSLGASIRAEANDATKQLMHVTKFVLPEYPLALRSHGVPEGEVLMAINYDANGRVIDALALEATRPEFAESAIEAVNEWRFEPLTEGRQARAPLVRFIFKSTGVFLSSGAERKTQNRHIQGVPSVMGYQTITFEELDNVPKPLNKPMPALPESLRAHPSDAQARVAFFVDEKGHVRVPWVTAASTPEFGDLAIQSVTQWRYEPPRRNGQPVVAYETLNFKFGASARP